LKSAVNYQTSKKHGWRTSSQGNCTITVKNEEGKKKNWGQIPKARLKGWCRQEPQVKEDGIDNPGPDWKPHYEKEGKKEEGTGGWVGSSVWVEVAGRKGPNRTLPLKDYSLDSLMRGDLSLSQESSEMIPSNSEGAHRGYQINEKEWERLTSRSMEDHGRLPAWKEKVRVKICGHQKASA